MKQKIKANLTQVINQAVQWCDEVQVYEASKEWAESLQLQRQEEAVEEEKKEE